MEKELTIHSLEREEYKLCVKLKSLYSNINHYRHNRFYYNEKVKSLKIEINKIHNELISLGVKNNSAIYDYLFKIK